MDTKKLRQKILDLAIHGKLVPQDPNDEPASVLLERIRAEKEMLIKEGKIKAPKKSKSAGDTSHYPKEGPWELPEGWVWCRLEDFVYAVTDGDHLPPPQSNSGIPFLVISDVNTGVINFDKARFVPDSYYDSLPTIRKASIHDILFTVTGSYGIVIPVETKERFCFQRHIGLIKTIESHEWLVFVLQSRYVQAYCDKVATGTAQKTVSLGALRDLPIPIPPRKEQERIGERLQEWLTISNHLGVAGAELNRNIVLAKTKILDLAIHGKLVPQDPSDEPAIELLKRINPAFQPSDNLHYEGILPSGWTLCCLEDVLDYEQPEAYIVNSTDYSDDYKTPVLTPGKSFVLGYTNELSGICNHLPVIIFDDFTTESKYVDFPFKVKSSAMKILRARGEINLKYVAIFMSITRLVGDTHKRYWISEYSKIPIPIPPLREQGRIVLAAKHLLNQLDNLIASISDN